MQREIHLCFQNIKNYPLNPIQDGPFRGCSRMRGTKKAPFPKTRHTYPKIMKLGTIIPY